MKFVQKLNPEFEIHGGKRACRHYGKVIHKSRPKTVQFRKTCLFVCLTNERLEREGRMGKG